MLILLLALALNASASDFAPTPALADLAQAGAAARSVSAFPSCRPGTDMVNGCLTNADAFWRSLPPAARISVEGALRNLIVKDIATELKDATRGDTRAQADIATLIARANDPKVDVWRLAASAANGLTGVDFFPDIVTVVVPVTLSSLLPPGAEDHFIRAHNGLNCGNALLNMFFDSHGNLQHVGFHQGACFDANE